MATGDAAPAEEGGRPERRAGRRTRRGPAESRERGARRTHREGPRTRRPARANKKAVLFSRSAARRIPPNGATAPGRFKQNTFFVCPREGPKPEGGREPTATRRDSRGTHLRVSGSAGRRCDGLAGRRVAIAALIRSSGAVCAVLLAAL